MRFGRHRRNLRGTRHGRPAAEEALPPMANPSVSNAARVAHPAQVTFGQDGAPAASDNLVQFISFAIGDDQYGVDIMAVPEIKEWNEITHPPKQHRNGRGVLNLRRDLAATIDHRCPLRHSATE